MPFFSECAPSPAPGLGCDRTQFPAFEHFYIPAVEDATEIIFEPILRTTPTAFIQLAESFKRNAAAVISTASMPFRMASSNFSHRLFHRIFLAERIRALKIKNYGEEETKDDEEEEIEIATAAARKKYSEEMTSDRKRHEGALIILTDLGNLLVEEEMVLAAAELMRQSEALTWGILEVLANDLFVCLLNKNPQLTEILLREERTKRRFQARELTAALSTHGYDLSGHMGEVLNGIVKIDDVETLRDVYGTLMYSNSEVVNMLRDDELWKLNQRRNLILHRRSIVDQTYLRNTGDQLPIGTELAISPAQLDKDLSLVLRIGSSMLGCLVDFVGGVTK